MRIKRLWLFILILSSSRLIAQCTAAPAPAAGGQAAPVAQISPANVNFPEVPVGTTASQSVVVCNSGNADMTAVSHSIAGTDATSFGYSFNAAINPNSCGNVLQPGQSCSLLVSFSPSSPASRTASLSVASTPGAPNNPTTIPLTGSGLRVGTPVTRAVAGIDVSAASSTDPQQKYFVEFNLNAPLRFRQKRHTFSIDSLANGGVIRANGVVTLKTVTNNNVSVGQQVTVAGIAAGGFNGTFTVISVLDAQHFQYAQAGSNGTAGGGLINIAGALTIP